ncbi:MAG: heparinase II/III family protein [Verrucomicrobiota bacterium]
MVALGVCIVAHAGPTLSDSNLFAAINLNYPGLDLVRTNVAQTNYVAAKTNLAAYLRARTNVNWYFDPHAVTNTINCNQAAADQTTNGYVNSIGIGYTFSNAFINWSFNVTTNPSFGYATNNEWQWQMNRMGFWPNLGDTWWKTGNDVYTMFWVAQLRNWLTNCPVPTSQKNGAGSCWRTIESGIRMGGSWPNTYHRFLLAPSFTDQDVCDYLKSCIEHSRYLSNFCTSGNWLTMEMSGLYTVGALFPEVKDATSWRVFAGQKLYVEETNQFYPDGVQKEMSPGYHGVALGNILTIYNVAALENLVPELPTNYLVNLENGYNHYLRLMAPDRMLPAFNDSISAPDAKGPITTAYSLFTNRMDFLWVASDGASGTSPAFVSYNYPWAGYNVMRSGWNRTDNYLCLDNGPMGAAHQHQDKLNVVLWAFGRKILFDSGGGNYETSIWRSYGVSSYSHNTVVVDGRDQAGGNGSVSYSNPDYVSQTPVNSRWETDLNHDFAAGIYNLGYSNYTYRPASHTRRVLFVKPDIYLVADTLAPTNTASHTYEARWHLLPTNTVTTANTKAVTTTDSGVPNLAVVPCLLSNLTVAAVVGRSNTTYNLLLGWTLIGSQPEHLPATTITHTLTATGTNHFLTLLMPLATGATNSVTNVVALGATSSRLELSDGRKLLVSADPNPARGIRLVELLMDGTTNRIAGGGYSPPVISAIADQNTTPNLAVGPIAFTVGGTNLSASNLVLIAHSQNTMVIADSGIVFGGAGSNRTVTITPNPGRAGIAGIELTALDTNGATTTIAFNVNIQAPTTTTWYWDATTNAGLQSASGNWSQTDAMWSATNTGSNPLLPWPVDGNDAYFLGSGGTYTVNVSNTQNVGHLFFTNGTYTLSGGTLNHFVGSMNLTAHGNATLNTPLVSDTDLIKLGAATLTLGAPAIFSGNTFVNLGTLQLAANDLLPAASGLTLGNGGNAGKLDLSAASQSFSSLTITSTNSTGTNLITLGGNQKLIINGGVTVAIDSGTNSYSNLRIFGAGAFIVTNPAANVLVGLGQASQNYANSASLDLTKLGSVTLGNSSTPINELRIAYGQTTSGTLWLSDTNNLINATTMQVGNSTGSNPGSGNLILGAGANLLTVDTLNIGLSKASGTLKFASQTSGSPGTVTISGRTGAAANIWIGYKNGTGTAGAPVSTLDLRGHPATVTAGTLCMGIDNGNGSGGDTGNLYFDNGTFTVTNINMAAKSVGNTGPASATLSVGGGIFTVCSGGSFTLASQSGGSTASGNLIITGGVFNCQTDILDGGGTNTSTVTLNGGTLDLFGHNLGSTTNINVLNFQSGTLQNVGEINGGSNALVKTSSGTLTLAGVNGFSGGTVVNAGTLMLAGSLASSLSVTGGVLSGSGTIDGPLTIAAPATFSAHINGATAGSQYDQLITTGNNGTVTLSGSLQLVMGVSLPDGIKLTLIKNGSSTPVSGTFKGLPQMATITTNGMSWSINYAGGDGNDVELTLISGGSNEPPTVSLLSPTNGATVTSPVTLMADASAPNNTLARVEFYGDNQKLGELVNSPYNFAWTNIPSGYHVVFARAVNTLGLSAQTPPVLLLVNWPVLSVVTNGSDWKYHDQGQNLGTNWQRPDFNDQTWPSGPAPLGYGDANGLYPRTTNTWGPDSNNKYITTYYRRAFVVTNVPAWSNATLSIQRDDGAVVYLNAVEVFRSNMPTGQVSYLTLASSAVSGANETNWYGTNLDATLLNEGTNLFAVEIHQNAGNSSDIWFDLRLTAQPTNTTPRLQMAGSRNTLQLRWPIWAAGLTPWYATNLMPPIFWNPATNSVSVTNGWQVLSPPATVGKIYYRLQSQ